MYIRCYANAERNVFHDVGANLVFALCSPTTLSMIALRGIAGDHENRPYDCDGWH